LLLKGLSYPADVQVPLQIIGKESSFAAFCVHRVKVEVINVNAFQVEQAAEFKTILL
jgi:hypothetical protein